MFTTENTIIMAEKLAKKKDVVTVYGTGKGRLAFGKEYKLHSIPAAKLVAKGVASEDKPTQKPAGKASKKAEK
jgi:hypothetical protein